MQSFDDDQSILDSLFSNGIPYLNLTGLILIGSGCFAIFLSFSGHFLPHDTEHIGYNADQLELLAPNLVKFMFHDRAAFGGALIAIGILYLWLASYPLKLEKSWAWPVFCISGIFGFGSFLAYVGYGYLDTWHGLATLCLLPVFLVGLWLSKPTALAFSQLDLHPLHLIRKSRQYGLGFGLICFYAAGLILGGTSILAIGMTSVFVPQDLAFIGLCGADIDELSENLIPVVAHDRAGFGGGLLTIGVTTYLILTNARWSRSLRQSIALSGFVGFASAIGIHFYIGYTDFIHLLPAYIGAGIFTVGIFLTPSRS